MTDPHPKTTFLSLPQEITEHAMISSDPSDVAQLAQVCRYLNAIVYNLSDNHVWRSLFLNVFDDPRAIDGRSDRGDGKKFDWKGELQRRIRARTVMHNISTGPTKKKDISAWMTSDARCDVYRALLSVISTASPPSLSSAESLNITFLSSLLRSTNSYSQRLWPCPLPSSSPSPPYTDLSSPDFIENQLRSKLSCHLGLTQNEKTNASVGGGDSLRVKSQAFIYDLRNYRSENGWGPYLPDNSGSVNWEHLNHIMITVSMNAHDAVSLWNDSCPHIVHPKGLSATLPYSAPGSSRRKPWDWAGVEGSWRRIVCFMDYHDLIAYNYSSSSPTGPLSTSIFTSKDFTEAVHVLSISISLIAHPMEESPIPLPDDYPDPTRPPLRFKGTSRGYAGHPPSLLRGEVKLTKDGDIQWSVVSHIGGVPTWTSEGTQIGGPCSAMGVLGIWTGVNHEEGDPAGPYWFWKVDGPPMAKKAKGETEGQGSFVAI